MKIIRNVGLVLLCGLLPTLIISIWNFYDLSSAVRLGMLSGLFIIAIIMFVNYRRRYYSD